MGALFVGTRLHAAEVIPPAPLNHFNDYAGFVRADTAARLEAELTQFERESSNQILVVIYPHMQSDSSIEDYTVRVAQAWRVGQAGKKNGAVLFIFSQDRTIHLQVGYGLEAELTDARCKQIIADEITSRFRTGDVNGGVTAGVHAIIASARGEYQGTGRTVTDRRGGNNNGTLSFVFLVMVVILFIASVLRRRRGGTLYQRGGRIVTWGGGGFGGGFGGGGGGGSGGSFSGGGGSFGGGGAGGSW